jgi:hypothetical protein
MVRFRLTGAASIACASGEHTAGDAVGSDHAARIHPHPFQASARRRSVKAFVMACGSMTP